MLIIKRSLVFLMPLAVILALGWFFQRPQRLYWLIGPLLLLLALTIWELANRQRQKNFWYFLSSPALFLVSLFLNLLFIEQSAIRWLIGLAGAVFLAIILENLFVYFHQPHRYQPCALENIYNYFNLLALFLFFSGVYSLIIFLDLPVALLAVLIFAVVVIFGFQAGWLYQLAPAHSWFYWLTLALMMTELFAAVSFLPTSFYVNGAILASAYYFLSGLICSRLLNRLERTIIKRYCLIALAALVIILGTARWL